MHQNFAIEFAGKGYRNILSEPKQHQIIIVSLEYARDHQISSFDLGKGW